MSFIDRLDAIDRRWIFLMMACAVAIPIIVIGLTGARFPEVPGPTSTATFETIEALPEGAKVLFSFDFDPASAGELQPMANAFMRHLGQKKAKVYCQTLWASATPLIEETLKKCLLTQSPDLVYGVDYVNLGYQAGNEGVMKVISTDYKQSFPTDAKGTRTTAIPMMEGIENTSSFDLIMVVSAGYPGSKEWVQYVVSPTLGKGKPIQLVAGVTGVSAPQLVPYFPTQMQGMLAAIKGAAEYEYMVNEVIKAANPGKPLPPAYMEAQRRMAPQLFGHLLMVGLIIVGNTIFFVKRRQSRSGSAMKAAA
ncbi:MAG: hypothetical protein O2819_04825 [Planctomycetota bacterium]|nr:hypothetical protein [Planctomycetota bacterium]MDA1105972.1 hypothetical protein [Planctomycetota bacterium]